MAAPPNAAAPNEPNMPIARALVFDWGGVLTVPLDDAMAAWAQREGVVYDHFREVLAGWGTGQHSPVSTTRPVATVEQSLDLGAHDRSPVHRLEVGELSEADFELQLAGELERRGSRVAPAGLLSRLLADLTPLEPAMVELVRRARAAGLRTALLSNSWGEHYPEALWHDGLFDAVVISGRVKIRKPDPRIFALTCERLNLPPGACTMIDDLPRNVTAAQTAGMTGVVHRSSAETARELEKLLDLTIG